VSGILTWLSISIIHIRFRNAFILQGRDIKNELSFLAPFYPFGQYVAIFLGLCIIVGQAWAAYLESTYLVLVTFAGIPLFLGLFFSYKFANGSEIVNLKEVNLDALARMGSFSEDLEHQEFHSLEESDLQ
jgi:lysine-specific permease